MSGNPYKVGDAVRFPRGYGHLTGTVVKVVLARLHIEVNDEFRNLVRVRDAILQGLLEVLDYQGMPDHPGSLVVNEELTGSGPVFGDSSSSSEESVSSGVEDKGTVVTVSEDYEPTGVVDVILADASRGSLDITLPAAATCEGRAYYIKKIDSSSNYVDILAEDGGDIDGEDDQYLTVQNDAVKVVSDGSVWWVL